jgi:hypothetical protein
VPENGRGADHKIFMLLTRRPRVDETGGVAR